MRGACRDTVPLLLLRVGLVCSAAGPLWQLPAPSTELCSKVLFHASGVEVALQRYPELKVAVSLDGEFLHVPNPLGHLRTDTLAASEPGVPSAAQNAAPWFTINNVKNGMHAVSLELVNRTTHGLHFVVYQHLIAFTTSASPACRTWNQQFADFQALKSGGGVGGGPEHAAMGNGKGDEGRADRGGGRRRREHPQAHAWRAGMSLLQTLALFPPLVSEWRPHHDDTIEKDCNAYSGVCFKRYAAMGATTGKPGAPFTLLSGPLPPRPPSAPAKVAFVRGQVHSSSCPANSSSISSVDECKEAAKACACK